MLPILITPPTASPALLSPEISIRFWDEVTLVAVKDVTSISAAKASESTPPSLIDIGLSSAVLPILITSPTASPALLSPEISIRFWDEVTLVAVKDVTSISAARHQSQLHHL